MRSPRSGHGGLVLLGLSALLSGCSAASGIGTLLPGSSALSLLPVASTCDNVSLQPRDSTARAAGQWPTVRVERQTRTDSRDTTVLLTNQLGSFGWDSLMVRRGGLEPIWEASQQGAQRTRWDYGRTGVQVHTITDDSTIPARHERFRGPFFTFQELDLVIEALPLREGFSALLPLFSEVDDRMELDSVRVQASSPAGQWSIRFADSVIVATFLVDGATRRIVGYQHVFRKDGAAWKAGSIWERAIRSCSE